MQINKKKYYAILEENTKHTHIAYSEKINIITIAIAEMKWIPRAFLRQKNEDLKKLDDSQCLFP